MTPRIFLCLLLMTGLSASSLAIATAAPEIDRPVVDEVGVLSPMEIDRISQKLYDHHAATGVQMAVLFVDTTDEEPIEDFSLRVANNWEGGSAARDDGALLTFAIEDRENRLELGYGLEPLISDARAGSWLRDIRTDLRNERYGHATEYVVDQVIASTRHLEPDEEIPTQFGDTATMLLTLAIFFFAMAFSYFWPHFRREITYGPDTPAEEDVPLGARDAIAWIVALAMVPLVVGPGKIPIRWDIIGGTSAMISMIPMWLIVAITGAWALRSVSRRAWYWMMCLLFHIFCGFAIFSWATTSPADFAVIFGLSFGFFGYFLFWLFLYVFGIAMVEGKHGGQPFSGSSGGFSGGGGGSGGGGSVGGGFSGGGGSFGGGGASGSW